MIRVATYARINRADAQPMLEAQNSQLLEHVNEHADWTLIEQFTDLGSGNAPSLPGIGAAIDQARAGAFDLLLVYNVDRLSRSLVHMTNVLGELRAAGVRICSVDGFDSARPAEVTMSRLRHAWDG